ncbi:MAG: HNH endonuclease signature motif containing protein [Mycobacteriales bacterium]
MDSLHRLSDAVHSVENMNANEITALTDERLIDELTTWAGRVAAAEAHLLRLVDELDRREAWAGAGLLSCGHWLSWRLGMGLKAAHERVRVARALRALPQITSAFGRGELSWTQVRAITRVAGPADEASYLECARHCTGAQIEKLARGVRRARAAEDAALDADGAAYRRRPRVAYDEDGTLVITVRLDAADGPLVLAALTGALADLGAEWGTEAGVESNATTAESSAEDGAQPKPTLTDALVQVATDWLARQAREHPRVARRRRSHLVVQVDPLSGWARLPDGELLPPSVVGPSAALVGVPLRRFTRRDLTRHDAGRQRRLPSLALRELLGAIDGERCRYPGCVRLTNLHAHHVREWAQGGRTDLANLLLLCSRHHTVVHERGTVLRLHPDRMLTVMTDDGTPVLHRPPLPWRDKAELVAAAGSATIGADTLPPLALGDRLDRAYAVSVLCQQAA